VQQLVDAMAGAGERLVIIDFFAPWCAACKALYPKASCCCCYIIAGLSFSCPPAMVLSGLMAGQQRCGSRNGTVICGCANACWLLRTTCRACRAPLPACSPPRLLHAPHCSAACMLNQCSDALSPLQMMGLVVSWPACFLGPRAYLTCLHLCTAPAGDEDGGVAARRAAAGHQL
jgi:hypothetical protein